MIFGFHQSESWGSWSAGGKSCLVLPEFNVGSSPITITIKAHPFRPAFSSCKVFIKTSTGHRGSVRITGDGSVCVRLSKPIIPRNQRLVIGDISKIKDSRNGSLSTCTPTVTIIIINYDKSHLTCLSAVAAASSGCRVSFEILCMDNGSSASSIQCLEKFEVPMRIVELGANEGYGPANNLAAKEARGQYLLFLNNDAFLDEGAVDELFRAFQEMPDCRIAGSVLRYPDGTMQEAGATLQPDGHPIRHGRNDHMFKTRKLRRFQPVDYVSGACMMIRKSDFLSMGGFAEKYSPAYYEDTDLCMRSLLYGQKVYLASRANCYHIENATTSTIEDGVWASRTAEAHREIFLKDWGAYLTSRDPQDLPRHLAQ